MLQISKYRKISKATFNNIQWRKLYSRSYKATKPCHFTKFYFTLKKQISPTVCSWTGHSFQGLFWRGLSQWEEALLCNAVSHWPSPHPDWSPLLAMSQMPQSYEAGPDQQWVWMLVIPPNNISWYIICFKAHCRPGIKTHAFHFMMTSSNGDIFRVTGHLCREFTGPRWIPHTKASDAELWCFLWSASE